MYTELLGEILVRDTALSEAQLTEALRIHHAAVPRRHLGEVLLTQGSITPEELAKALAQQWDLHYLETIVPEQLCRKLIGQLGLGFLKRHKVLPVTDANGQIEVAMADPLNVAAYDAVLTVAGRYWQRAVSTPSQIEQAISRSHYRSADLGPAGGNDESTKTNEANSDKSINTVPTEIAGVEDLLDIANQEPIIKLVNAIFFQAVQHHSSDIHIEPYDNEVRVRYRIDGVLHDAFVLAKHQIGAVISRLKIMANLNIAERRLPQDGQSRIKIGDKQMDIRVSIIPTSGGERVVLRLLDKGGRDLSLIQLGFARQTLQQFGELIARPHGILLLTGPTGSGKTTTLYAALNELNSQERNILTVEDPIEYQIPGIGQMQVKPKINLTFANCLRHILRQDPDIIMIGEIRDTETAEIAVQASLTGHLVLSTLHTNDSASAFTRLIDMGIEPYLIASSLIAVMAQRLVRQICPACKTECRQSNNIVEPDGSIVIPGNGIIKPGNDIVMSGDDFDILSNSVTMSHNDIAMSSNDIAELSGSNESGSPGANRFYHGTGCSKCLETGYRGRTGIFELLVIDDDIRELIIKCQPSHVVNERAIKKGMVSLRQDGIRKARAGETTVEEILRVTQDNPVCNLPVTEHAVI